MDQTAPHTRASFPVRRLGARWRRASAPVEVVSDDRLSVGSDPGNDLVVEEPTVSRFHAVLRRSGRGIEIEDLESTNGVLLEGVRLHRAAVAPGAVLALGAAEIEVFDAGLGELELRRGLPDLIAVAPSTRATLARVERAANTRASVLLTGESGTGKERFAEALHRLGPRAEAPFVVVDCGAIPASLLASELFGHERGAFTGAREARAGAFERAAGGTVFLDEVAELGGEAAQLLSGALARGTFRRVGGSVEFPMTARMVSATHQDLLRCANEGRFRSDLVHRLAEVRITVTPLRERSEEIEPLIDHFLAKEGARSPFSEARLAAFRAHPWPGNVRELRQVVLAELATREPVELLAVPPKAGSPSGAFDDVLGRPFREARDEIVGRFEQHYLSALLRDARENVAEAARTAGIDRTHLHDLLRRHGLR